VREVALELLLAAERADVFAHRREDLQGEPPSEVFDGLSAPLREHGESVRYAAGLFAQAAQLASEFLRRFLDLRHPLRNAVLQRDRRLFVRETRGRGDPLPPFAQVNRQSREGEQLQQQMPRVTGLLRLEHAP
jgi:hypothetical protein